MHDFVLAYKVGFYPHNEKPPGTPVDFYFKVTKPRAETNRGETERI